ncbi:hypothetical protein [Pimelobacter sp. 30-1]|uniref:hypothetical protein n=1 Tax=Pimelobacter sp. 30-1 TaxID=2004991 RepID=UPI001C042501|nr:hypothetical protein [Pimelobacter sp. 30-1]
MSVAIATRVFGSEVLVALIRHYRESPGPQIEAAQALNLPPQLISANTRILINFGVVIGDPPGRGRRAGRYVVDEERVQLLLAELAAYVGAGKSDPRT